MNLETKFYITRADYIILLFVCQENNIIDIKGELSNYARQYRRYIKVFNPDKEYTLFLLEGTGKPTQKTTFEAFGSRITQNSTLLHDKEVAHKKLVTKFGLNSISYSFKELKEILDKDNPLYPIGTNLRCKTSNYATPK